MKPNPFKVFKTAILLTCLAGWALATGQEKQSKSYKESFDVQPDAVVDIDVSYADISFETWDKNQVSVEATVELEGATKEEARDYFKNNGIEILGNSSKVEIRTPGGAPFPPGIPNVPMVMDVPDIDIPNVEPLFLDLQIPDLAPMPDLPPFPPAPMPNFDYEAYKKDGDKYMKKWKAEFDKNFDKDYRDKLEAWSEEMAKREEERQKDRKKLEEEREKMQEERDKMMEEQRSRREEAREMAREQRERMLEQRQQAREQADQIRRQVIISGDGDDEAPVIFYRSSDGENNKNLKIKKTIKVRLPKSVKLKMNVRHGEVKLAENTQNLHATLSYTRLLASTIDGENTQITANYSPVDVSRWNFGSLRTDFSDKVALREVKNLNLKANSSNVTIDRLLKSVHIENNLGRVHINSVADSFNAMVIVLQNGELYCSTPAIAYGFKFRGTASKFVPPDFLQLTKSGADRQTDYSGYHLNNDPNRSIFITSNYSEVTLSQ